VYGEFRLKKEFAEKIRDLALEAITNLSKIPLIGKDNLSKGEYDNLVRSVGSCIGHVQHQILSDIFSEHPDLDDLT
jgi:hypothetical protein